MVYLTMIFSEADGLGPGAVPVKAHVTNGNLTLYEEYGLNHKIEIVFEKGCD